jgi:glycosyltransferase involved in cell wall biosynthesis
LIPRKSFDTLLQAAALLKARDGLRFAIFGDGPERTRLLALSRQLGIADMVQFAGWQEDIVPSLLGLDVFVLPSSSEAFGLVIAEAMACALPVVATKVGGIPEIVRHGETGLLVPPKDPAALAEAIWTLANSLSLRVALGRAGRRRAVRHFSADRMVEQTALHYHNLLRCQQASRRPRQTGQQPDDPSGGPDHATQG